MKKIVLILYSVSILILLSACQALFWNPPTKQHDSLWVADEYSMFFRVDMSGSVNMGTIGGYNNNEDIIIIKLLFDNSPGVAVYDNDRLIINNDGGSYYSESILFIGNCTSAREKFTITVTRTEIDSIDVGDKITFNRVEELPEWALEMESDASFEEASEE